MELDLTKVLTYLVGGGSVLATSWILERVAWYQALDSRWKEWVFFGVASIIAVTSYLLPIYAPDLLESLKPFFVIVAGVFSYVFLGKKFHETDKELKAQ